jgi:hypothetical protein
VSHTLVQEYRKLIDKHWRAVQTDAKLEYSDSPRLEQISKQFMNEFLELERKFVAKLEAIDEDQMDKSV